MNDLSKPTCVPCQGGVPKMAGEELREYSAKLPDWKVVDEHHLEREFSFPDFVTALAYVNRIGELAEEQNHHPDIFLSWGVVRITAWPRRESIARRRRTRHGNEITHWRTGTSGKT